PRLGARGWAVRWARSCASKGQPRWPQLLILTRLRWHLGAAFTRLAFVIPGRGLLPARPESITTGQRPLFATRYSPIITSPIDPASYWVKNSRPSARAVMQRAPLFGVGISYSPRATPSGAMRPILLAKFAVYQRSPSAPTVTPRRDAFGVGTGCSVMRPKRSMRPSALVEVSTNQIEPSGWDTIARGWLSWLGIGNSVTLPSMVIRP